MAAPSASCCAALSDPGGRVGERRSFFKPQLSAEGPARLGRQGGTHPYRLVREDGSIRGPAISVVTTLLNGVSR